MRALSIRQPFAELILRGIKTAELRSRSTTIIGERFWIYASKTTAAFEEFDASGRDRSATKPVWSRDLGVAKPPAWMIELAGQIKLIEPDALLPRGVIVGSAVIEKVIPPDPADGDAGLFRWQLTDVERLRTPRKPNGHPQPVWFRPF